MAETVPHGEAGFFVPPEHPEALAGSITKYFSDPELRNRLDEGARRQHGGFSWAALAAALESQAPSHQDLNRWCSTTRSTTDWAASPTGILCSSGRVLGCSTWCVCAPGA